MSTRNEISKGLQWLAEAVLLFVSALVLASPAWSDQGSKAMEKVHNSVFLGTEMIDGERLLHSAGRKDVPLAPNFSLSDCGRELTATVDSLQAMVGRPFDAVVVREGRRWLVTRLEFRCK